MIDSCIKTKNSCRMTLFFLKLDYIIIKLGQYNIKIRKNKIIIYLLDDSFTLRVELIQEDMITLGQAWIGWSIIWYTWHTRTNTMNTFKRTDAS